MSSSSPTHITLYQQRTLQHPLTHIHTHSHSLSVSSSTALPFHVHNPHSTMESPSRCSSSTCFRHPSDPTTGICPSCLRDRLYGLDPDSPKAQSQAQAHLTRCRSVSNLKKEQQQQDGYTEPRRASCDVGGRSSLGDLLGGEDDGLGRAHSAFLGLQIAHSVHDGDEDNVGGDEVRTMKEFIDLEVRTKDRKVNALNLFGAASVFSKRVRRWKDKGLSKKKVSENVQRENLDRRRRSCDTETAFYNDVGRASIDEPRASWDGYLVSRTIPSLAPMLYVVENGLLGSGSKFDTHRLSVDGQMQAIMEDESSSGGSGLCNSDSLSSQRWSSFDRSSSVRSKKTVGLESDEARSPTKLIITERELKDWQLKSAKDDSSATLEAECKAIVPLVSGRDLNKAKKAPTWRKMFNVLGLKAKSSEKKSDNLRGISVDKLLGEGCEKQWSKNQGELKDASGCKRKVGGTFVSARKSFDVASLEKSIRNRVDPKAKPSEKKHGNLKGISVDRLLGEGCQKQWSENQGKLKDASGCKIKVGGSIASTRKSFDVVTLDQSIRNDIDQKDMSGWKLSRSGSVASSRRSIDFSGLHQNRKNGDKGDKVKEASGCRLARSGSIVSSRRSLDISTRSVSEHPGVAGRRGEDFVLELHDKAKKRLSKVDDETLPFYLMPLRTSKSGRHRS